MSDPATITSLLSSAESILRERAESLAREAEDRVDADLVSLLLFRVGDEWYAVSLGDVREIMQDFSVTPLPCVPDFVQGVTNVRGEILSVTEASGLMQVPGSASAAVTSAPAVVLTSGEIATALVVEEIGDIVEVSEDAIEPPVSAADRIRTEFVSATAEIDGRIVAVVNTERVLAPVITGGRH